MFRFAVCSLLSLILVSVPSIAAEIPIAGKVLGADGAPAGKVEVVLEALPGSYERALLRLDGKPGPEPTEHTVTGEDGSFELAVPEAGMWKVVARSPGALTMECRLVPLVEPAVLPPLTLVPAEELTVRLRGPHGEPRVGRVGVQNLDARGAWRPQLRLAAADDEGTARLPVGGDETVRLEALADGHPLQVVDELKDTTSLTLDLPEGVEVKARFTSPGGGTVAGVVAIQGSALLPLGIGDESGRLDVVLEKGAEQPLQALARDLRFGSFDLDLEAEPEGVKKLRLEPPGTVRGRVLSLADREPVPGAFVWSVRGELAIADEKGQYSLDRGAHRSSWLRAVSPGYELGSSRIDENESQVSIGLRPVASLAGKVVDADGQAVAGVVYGPRLLGAAANGTRAGRRLLRDRRTRTTPQDGTFQISGLPTGAGIELFFEAPGFGPKTLEVAPLEPFESRTGLEVVLRPGHLGFGRVVDEDEVPVVGAEVRLEETVPSQDLLLAMRMRRSRGEEEPPHDLTGEDGRFEVRDLTSGRFDLSVRAAGFAPTRVPGVPVDPSGRATDFGTVVLVPGAVVEGRVVDRQGAPIKGAEVQIESGQRGLGDSAVILPEPVRTDSAGSFLVSDLLPGRRVALSASKDGFGTAIVPAIEPPTSEPLEVVLAPAGILKGRALDEQGDPIEGVIVRTSLEDLAMTSSTMASRRRHLSARTEADGRFRIENVEAGRLRVSAEASGYQQQVRSGVEMKEGGEVELELVLEIGAVVEGTVTTADGEPVVEVMVAVAEQQDGLFGGHLLSAHGQSDLEGRYRVTGAPTGPATITLHGHQARRQQKNIEIRPGTNVVDLVLDPGYEISGQVVDPEGFPRANAVVSIEESRQMQMGQYFSTGSFEETTSAADGTFTLAGVPAGRYKVIASREGFARAESEVLEVDSDRRGILLELRRGAELSGRVLGLELEELASLSLVLVGENGSIRRTSVDYAGAFVFENLTAGGWHLQAQVAGSGRSMSLQVEIPEGVGVVEKDLEFGEGFTLHGVVLSGGQPVAGAMVVASGGSGAVNGQTDSSGRFRLESLQAGRYSVMVAHGTRPHLEEVQVDGDRELRIEIPSGSIVGVVLEAVSGEVIVGAKIKAEPIGGSQGDSLLGRLGFGLPVTSDSQGVFRLSGLRSGTYRLVASKAGYGPGEVVATPEDGSEVEIRLAPTEGVTFEVALASGAPVRHVQVAILEPATGRMLSTSTLSVSDGKVRASTVPPGPWELVVQAGDSASTRFAVVSPGEQGRFLLPTAGTLHLEVPELEAEPMVEMSLTGPDGKPFVSAMGTVIGPGQWILQRGETSIPSLFPGTWTFRVTHGDRTWSGSAMVTPGETTEVRLP